MKYPRDLFCLTLSFDGLQSRDADAILRGTVARRAKAMVICARVRVSWMGRSMRRTWLDGRLLGGPLDDRKLVLNSKSIRGNFKAASVPFIPREAFLVRFGEWYKTATYER